MKILVDIDIEKLSEYTMHPRNRNLLLQDVVEDVLGQVAEHVGQPGAIDGDLELSGFGRVGSWEMVA